MKQYYKLLYILFVLSFAGCKNALLDPEVVVNIDQEFQIDLWENLDNATPAFEFKVETLKKYNCANNTISYTKSLSQILIGISLENIEQSNDCMPGEAPAQVKIPLPSLNNKDYSISINLKGTIENRGILSVKNNKYQIKMFDKDGLSIVREELRRVPKGSIWGYIAYDQGEDKAVAEQFMEELKQLPGLTQKNLHSGYYGYFTIEQEGEVRINQTIKYNHSRHFYYEYTGASTDLKDLINRYTTEHGHKAQFQIADYL